MHAALQAARPWARAFHAPCVWRPPMAAPARARGTGAFDAPHVRRTSRRALWVLAERGRGSGQVEAAGSKGELPSGRKREQVGTLLGAAFVAAVACAGSSGALSVDGVAAVAASNKELLQGSGPAGMALFVLADVLVCAISRVACLFKTRRHQRGPDSVSAADALHARSSSSVASRVLSFSRCCPCLIMHRVYSSL
jgi:hypothetical protein